MIEIRQMHASEINRLGEIDRSEHITLEYYLDDGKLLQKDVDIHVPRWPLDGPDSFSVTGLIKQVTPYLEQGAVMYGAFDSGKLVGIAILRFDLTQIMAQLVFLHVSRDYRRKGIASNLVGVMGRLAIENGAAQMYVSSAPTESAVGFYMHHGFRPTPHPIKELVKLEPEDIHMTKEL